MMDYATMPAGPEMDRLVAERVMGWTVAAFLRSWESRRQWQQRPLAPGEMPRPGSGDTIAEQWGGTSYDIGEWKPSTNIACAWRVVERMRALGMCGGVQVEEGPTREPAPDGPRAYCASFFGTHKSDASGLLDHETNREAYADTAALAICRAALAATLR